MSIFWPWMRAGQVERVVAGRGRHDRRVVLAVRAQPRVRVEDGSNDSGSLCWPLVLTTTLRSSAPEIVDRLAGRVGDDHLDGVDFAA